MNILSIFSCFVLLFGFQLIGYISAISCYHDKEIRLRCGPPKEKLDCAKLDKKSKKNTRSSGLKRLPSIKDLDFSFILGQNDSNASAISRNSDAEAFQHGTASPPVGEMRYACLKTEYNEGFAHRACIPADRDTDIFGEGCRVQSAFPNFGALGIKIPFNITKCVCFKDNCNSARLKKSTFVTTLIMSFLAVFFACVGFKF